MKKYSVYCNGKPAINEEYNLTNYMFDSLKEANEHMKNFICATTDAYNKMYGECYHPELPEYLYEHNEVFEDYENDDTYLIWDNTKSGDFDAIEDQLSIIENAISSLKDLCESNDGHPFISNRFEGIRRSAEFQGWLPSTC